MFIEELILFISNKRNLIIGGDFNFVEDNFFDRCYVKENTRTNLCRHQKLWISFFKTLRLKESYLDRNGFGMTWSNGIQSSRLDRFYYKKEVDYSISYYENIFVSMSDHNMVTANLIFNENSSTKLNSPKKDNSWKLNESILNDPQVNDGIITLCNQIPEFKKYDEKWYEKFISKIIKFLKR